MQKLKDNIAMRFTKLDKIDGNTEFFTQKRNSVFSFQANNNQRKTLGKQLLYDNSDFVKKKTEKYKLRKANTKKHQ